MKAFFEHFANTLYFNTSRTVCTLTLSFASRSPYYTTADPLNASWCKALGLNTSRTLCTLTLLCALGFPIRYTSSFHKGLEGHQKSAIKAIKAFRALQKSAIKAIKAFRALQISHQGNRSRHSEPCKSAIKAIGIEATKQQASGERHRGNITKPLCIPHLRPVQQ